MSIDGGGTLDILATNTGTPATAYSYTRLTAGATRYYRVRRGRPVPKLGLFEIDHESVA